MKPAERNYKSNTYAIIVFSIFLFVGCTSQNRIEVPEHIRDLENLTVYSTDSEPISTIELIQEMSFGDTDEVIFGFIQRFTTDDSGRVYISDGGRQTVQVFSPDGSHLTSIGQEGSGPGEYQGISNIKTHSGRLYIQDTGNRKIDIYSLKSFELLDTVMLRSENFSRVEELDGMLVSDFFVRSNDAFLFRFIDNLGLNNYNERAIRYYWVNHEGELIEPAAEILTQDDHIYSLFELSSEATIFYESPAVRKPLMVYSNNDQIVSAWSEDILIKVHDQNGGYLHAFYYPFERRPMNRSEVIENLVGFNVDAFRSTEHPETWPSFHNLLIDDKHQLWLSTIVDDQEVYEWWVLDEIGELQTKFIWSRDKNLQEIRNGFAYTLEMDKETDLRKVVRYRIDLE